MKSKIKLIKNPIPFYGALEYNEKEDVFSLCDNTNTENETYSMVLVVNSYLKSYNDPNNIIPVLIDENILFINKEEINDNMNIVIATNNISYNNIKKIPEDFINYYIKKYNNCELLHNVKVNINFYSDSKYVDIIEFFPEYMDEIKEYFCNLHDNIVNQKYDNKPYSFHLDMVSNYVHKYFHLIYPYVENNICDLWISVYGHDSIEDARLTYNDICSEFSKKSADIIYLCTEYKGRNRKERKPYLFYHRLSKNRVAFFIKLCDFFSNMAYSLTKKSSMFKKYCSEYKNLEQYKNKFPEFNEIFDDIETMIKNYSINKFNSHENILY